MRSKFGNIQVTNDDGLFDSGVEASRWQELKLLEYAGEIFNLERQRVWELQPGFKWRDEDGKLHKERAITYVPDAEYDIIVDGKTVHVIEDVKGLDRKSGKPRLTELFKVKRKLFMYRYPDMVFKVVAR
jgi:hypothetical protein